jgi:adenylate cyclase
MTLYEFKRKILPQLIKVTIGVGIGLLVVILTQGWFFEVTFLRNIELLTIDYRYQNAFDPEKAARIKDEGDVVIVGISDNDLIALPESFPFPRDYYAHLIRNLTLAGARAIVFDITFESERDGDEALADMLRRVNNVVLAAKVQTGGSTEFAEVRSLEKTYNNVFYKDNKNIGIGIVNIIKDRDDVCRRYMPMIIAEGELTPTLAFAGLNKAFKQDPLRVVQLRDDAFVYGDRAIPSYNPSDFLLSYYGPVETFRYIPFSQVIDDQSFKTLDEIDYEMDINMFDESVARLIRGKVVLIGSLMAEERDYHNTPMFVEEGGKPNFAMHGVEIHATAIQNVLDKRFVSVLSLGWEILLVILFSVLGFVGLLGLKQLKVKYVWLVEIGVFLAMFITIGAIFELGVLLYSNNSLLINIVNPSLSVVLAYLGTAVYQYLTERQQKAMIKGVFSHYLNPSVVNMLVNDPTKAKLGGDRRELTIFFSDIAGFTTISEHFNDRPEGLVDLLNEYLDEMTSIVLKYDGTLDKYEGDAIMSFWGAPIPQRDHALRACYASLDMQRRLAELRPKWKKEGKPPLEVRIVLNTGICIAGNMGGKDRFDYTVIGDSVNLASRLEAANKQYGSFIMLSEFTYTMVKDKVRVRELDLLQVKGKTEPVKVFELMGKIDMKLTDKQKQSLEIYHEGLKLYRQKKWDEAIAYMQQAVELDPGCAVAKIYTERANLYQIAPPPEDWNGVFIMTSK